MDPRELIRLAQADELAGDRAGAAEKLRRAAKGYRDAGKSARAEQLERHAERLEGASSESGGDTPVQPERSGAESKAQNAPDVLMATRSSEQRSGHEGDADPSTPDLRSYAQGERKWPGSDEASARELDPFTQRAPSRADPSQRAWCSFCCRPDEEVGPLIASPTGAFICRGCAVEGLGLLGASTPEPVARQASAPATLAAEPVVRPAGVPSAPVPEPVARPPSLLETQQRTFEQLVLAVRAGRKRILVIGPEASGKSELLGALETFGLGARIPGAAVLDPPESPLLLIDGLRHLGMAGREQAAEALAGRAFVLCVRGELPEAALRIQSGEQRRPLYTTAELRLATGSQIPVALLEGVEVALWLPPLDAAALRELATRVLAAKSRRAEDALIARLVDEAVRSGRGAHELVALIHRLPSGASRLAPEEP